MKFEQAKEELNLQRKIQEESRNTEVRISGSPSIETESFLNNTKRIFESLEYSPEGEANKKAIFDLAEKLTVGKKELEEAYHNGLRYTIKAALKIGILGTESTQENIIAVIGGYTLNFRRMLKFFADEEKVGQEVPQSTIISAAKRGYVLSPELIEELRNTYINHPDVGEYMIGRSIHSSTNPEAMIRSNIEMISRLREKYKDDTICIEDWMIKTAVIGNRQPDAVLEKWLQQIKKFSIQYKDNPYVDAQVIKNAVTGHTDPEKRLEYFNRESELLNEKYRGHPDIDASTIKRVVLKNTNPEMAIQALLFELDELSERFSHDQDSDRAFIKAMILGYSDSKDLIEKKLAKIKELRNTYANNPDVEDWMLKSVVTAHDNPEESLKRIIKKIDELRRKYGKGAFDSEIKYAATINSDPDTYLDEIIRKRS